LGDRGVVLQALWEVRLPWSMALVGVPAGWNDENHWAWAGLYLKRSSGKPAAAQNEWLLGGTASAPAVADFAESGGDDCGRYLFSRRGGPLEMRPWVVPGSWLIGICSGVTLVVGVLAIFTRMRFRAIWLTGSLVVVLWAMLIEPTVTALLLEAAA